MIARNQFEEKARRKKVHAVVNHIECKALEQGRNPTEHDVLLFIVDQLESADAAKWTRLEASAGVRPLSVESRRLVLNLFRSRARLPLVEGPKPATPQPLGKCRCGADRDDPTDRDCVRCQLRDIGEGLRESAKSSGWSSAGIANFADALVGEEK